MVYACAQFDATDESGRLLDNVTVEIRRESGGAQAVFADRDGTVPMGSKFLSESGHVRFFAPGNSYRILLTKGSYQRELRFFGIGLASESDMVLRNFRGDWNAEDTYRTFEFVTHDGLGFFISTMEENTGIQPDAATPASTPEWTFWPQETLEGWRSFAELVVTGGTANAIEAVTEGAVDPASVVMLVLEPAEANTGPVTVNGTALLTFAGEPLEAGFLQAGAPVLLHRDGAGNFRLTMDHRFQALAGQIGADRDIVLSALPSTWQTLRDETVAAKGLAEEAADETTALVSTATDEANRSGAAADRAEAARDASLVAAGPVYATEAAGRAAVADGAQFTNLSADGFAIEKRWRVDSGSSVLVTSIPTKAITDRIGPIESKALAPESGYLFGLEDEQGNLGLGVNTAGRVVAHLSDDSIVPRSALSAEVKDSLLTGAVSGIMAPESGWEFAIMDIIGRVGFGLRSDGRVWMRLANDVEFPDDLVNYFVATALSTLLPSPEIVCWGDSLTAGAGGGGTNFPAILAAALGRTVTNKGIGGQTSAQIAARQGGIPILVSVTGNSIPAAGGVAVTSKNVNILVSSGSFAGTSVGKLAGVLGAITTDASGNWTFTRSDPGEIVSCPAGSPFVPDDVSAFSNKTVIIQAGRNDTKVSRAERIAIRNNVLSMVEVLTPLTKRVVVMADSGSSVSASGSVGYLQTQSLNDDLSAVMGDRYIDHRRYLIDHGLEDAGITPTTQDLADVASDVIPSSLRAEGDPIHLNATGYTLVGNFMARQLNARGW